MSDTSENVIEGRQVPIPKDIKDMDYKLLVDFAVDYGCNVRAGHTKQVILDMLRDRGWTENFIVVPDPAQEDEHEAALAAAGDGAAPAAPNASKAMAPGSEPAEVNEPMVTLTVNVQEGAGGKRPIFVAVNGRGMLIPRGRPESVKLRYWEALRLAEQTTFERDEETNVQDEKSMPSYPFQVSKLPSDAEVAAWRRWESHEEARLNPPKVKVAA